MTDLTLRQLADQTMKIDKQFPNQYDENESFLDLVEEVGELAQAMMISSGRKLTNDPKKVRTHEDVVDALCDVFFQLIRLADKHGVDLSVEYPKVLQHIQGRMDAGEFAKHD